MKKCILLLASAMMALSLAACTPTPDKQQASADAQTAAAAEGDNGEVGPEGGIPATTEAYKADTMEVRNQGNEDLPQMAGVTVYRINKTGDGLIQEMDALETETLEAEGLFDLMASYGILPDGTELISYEQEEDKATLNVSQLGTDDAMATRLMVESLVNTFTENFELEGGLILQENGEVFTIPEVEADEDGTMYYNAEYRKFQ